MTTTNKKFTRW